MGTMAEFDAMFDDDVLDIVSWIEDIITLGSVKGEDVLEYTGLSKNASLADFIEWLKDHWEDEKWKFLVLVREMRDLNLEVPDSLLDYTKNVWSELSRVPVSDIFIGDFGGQSFSEYFPSYDPQVSE